MRREDKPVGRTLLDQRSTATRSESLVVACGSMRRGHSSKFVSRPLLVLPGVKPASPTSFGESLQTSEALVRLPLFVGRQSANRRSTAAAWPRHHHFCASQLGGVLVWWRERFP